MMFGPDNKLYISNVGFGPEALGGGEILKVSFSCANDDSRKNINDGEQKTNCIRRGLYGLSFYLHFLIFAIH